MCDGLPVGENVAEVAGSQHVPQRGGGQQPGRAAVVVHVGHGVGGVGHLVVHDGVHKHRHAVLGQNLGRIKVEKVSRPSTIETDIVQTRYCRV